MTTSSSLVTLEALRIYDYSQLSEQEYKELRRNGNGDIWQGAAALGFDGRRVTILTYLSLLGEGRHYTSEIVVFNQSISKLGELSVL